MFFKINAVQNFMKKLKSKKSPNVNSTDYKFRPFCNFSFLLTANINGKKACEKCFLVGVMNIKTHLNKLCDCDPSWKTLPRSLLQEGQTFCLICTCGLSCPFFLPQLLFWRTNFVKVGNHERGRGREKFVYQQNHNLSPSPPLRSSSVFNLLCVDPPLWENTFSRGCLTVGGKRTTLTSWGAHLFTFSITT